MQQWTVVLCLFLLLFLQKANDCSSFSISAGTKPCCESTAANTIMLSSPPQWKRRSNCGRLPQSFTRTSSTTARRSSSSTLIITQTTSPTIVAAATAAVLASCTLIGYQFDRRRGGRRLPNGSGIVASLFSAAAVWDAVTRKSTAAAILPPHSFLITMCWTHVLPASLALLLLSYRPPPPPLRKGANTDGDDVSGSVDSVSTTIQRVCIPFVVASVGSLWGCLTSYQLARKFRWFSSLQDAQVATACLSASYIGGSVNYFAVARRIQQKQQLASGGTSTSPNLLGSLATADMITMAVYFAFLSVTLDWKWLRARFYTEDSCTMGVPKKCIDNAETTVTGGSAEVSTESDSRSPFRIIPGILLTGFTFGMVHLANCIEKLLGKWIPGTACAVIALVTPLLNAKIASRRWWQLHFRSTASVLADTFFLCFFASIGMGCDLQAAIRMGPACLLFSAVALTIHVLIALVGSSCLPSGCRVQLEDVWIASNAAIGGPATAAAFCSRLEDTSKLKGRTLAATFYGCGT